MSGDRLVHRMGRRHGSHVSDRLAMARLERWHPARPDSYHRRMEMAAQTAIAHCLSSYPCPTEDDKNFFITVTKLVNYKNYENYISKII